MQESMLRLMVIFDPAGREPPPHAEAMQGLETMDRSAEMAVCALESTMTIPHAHSATCI